MYGRAVTKQDWPGGRIPDFVRDLSSVAIAVISRDGVLIDANLGFSMLLPGHFSAADMLDVRDVFVNPRFEMFVTRRGARSDSAIYRGILNIGSSVEASVNSLHGVLYALEDSVLLVAEHEISGLDLLRAKLLRLNEELAEEQRRLSTVISELERQKTVAEAALRDRDSLSAKLASVQ